MAVRDDLLKNRQADLETAAAVNRMRDCGILQDWFRGLEKFEETIRQALIAAFDQLLP